MDSAGKTAVIVMEIWLTSWAGQGSAAIPIAPGVIDFLGNGNDPTKRRDDRTATGLLGWRVKWYRR